ncbi:hypothetical protein ANCDUO_07710 [Ancylostoma duodenale]|uniref:Uncharacterized protein n=1 Tax=Ancylostoma duodenale TaxID=51022 RepID=A0A0C2GLA8_9BILA|nr:hypothetical protein ANCDUO_07710 [Ancylostoma duodenale]
MQCSSCSSNGQNPLDDSGTRDGQMKGLLASVRYIRRSTGVKVIMAMLSLGFSKPYASVNELDVSDLFLVHLRLARRHFLSPIDRRAVLLRDVPTHTCHRTFVASGHP